MQTFNQSGASQREAIPGREKDMVMNAAGGYVFPVGPWEQLDRFLLLGTEGGTYYASERDLTKENCRNLFTLAKGEEGWRVVEHIERLATGNRLPKLDPAIYALAVCLRFGDMTTKKAVRQTFPRVIDIGTHLLHFCLYYRSFGSGFPRSARRLINGWFGGRRVVGGESSRLAYQCIKYEQRDGWSMRDVMRMTHPGRTNQADRKALYYYIVRGHLPDWGVGQDENALALFDYISAVQEARATTDPKLAAELIRKHRLTHEMVSNDVKKDAGVWDALLEDMPLGAMIRNLASMTTVGLLKPFSNATKTVCRALSKDGVKRARLHPVQILAAMRTYSRGRGFRGNQEWQPAWDIVDALDDAFYSAFDNVEKTGKRFVLGVDVSSSMSSGRVVGTPALTPREAAAAMVMATVRAEDQVQVWGFCHKMVPLAITKRTSVDQAVEIVSRADFGNTDCALPMLEAVRQKVEADAFVIYTDNETWVGDVHPVQALAEYRRRVVPRAKLVANAFTASHSSIADPNDGGMVDMIGLDSATPRLIADFVTDKI